MKVTPIEFKPMVRRPFWVAKVRWDHEHCEAAGPLKAQKLTSKKLKDAYSKYCTDDNYYIASKLEVSLLNIHFEKKYREGLLAAIKNGGGVVMPTRAYRGIAVSFKSAADVKKIATAAANEYYDQVQRASAKKDAKRQKAADRLESKYSAAVRRTKLHFFFRDDHLGNIEGSVTAGQLIDIIIANLSDESDVEDDLIGEAFGNRADSCVWEWLHDSDNANAAAINKLLKGKAVTGAGECGVQALAKTKSAAKEAAKKEFLRWDFD